MLTITVPAFWPDHPQGGSKEDHTTPTNTSTPSSPQSWTAKRLCVQANLRILPDCRGCQIKDILEFHKGRDFFHL